MSNLNSCLKSVADYWISHNVTQHKWFGSGEESMASFKWRCDQYPGYLSLMPVEGHDGKEVLDYGCGPGHDLVGFIEYSEVKRLVGVDVSSSSLLEAQQRIKLHRPANVEVRQLAPSDIRLPFDDASFDYIHSSGVLHHVPDLQATLRELSRVMKPGGRMRVMVYNYDSIWAHLYVAYVLQLRDKTIPADLPLRTAFARSTDGPNCPIANCYTSREFGEEARLAGLECLQVGAACSLWEMLQVQQSRLQACMDPDLAAEHREFLLALTFDKFGVPLYRDVPAGIDLVLELTKP